LSFEIVKHGLTIKLLQWMLYPIFNVNFLDVSNISDLELVQNQII
jgi:hypothetical protein